MKDFTLKAPAAAMTSRNILKSMMHRYLGDRMDQDGQPRWIYSQEPLAEPGSCWIRLRITQGDLPVALRECSLERPVFIPSEGDEIELTAWIAVQSKKSKRGNRYSRSEMRDAVICDGVLGYRNGSLSSALSIHNAEILDAPDVFHVQRGHEAFMRDFAHVRFHGRVIDLPRLKKIMTEGIGACRIYGFGLPDVVLHKECTA